MAVVIHASGATSILLPADGLFSLRELQTVVGGYIECVHLPDGRVLVLNEDGKRLQLARNARATQLLHAVGGALDDFVVGDVLLATRAELVEGDDA